MKLYMRGMVKLGEAVYQMGSVVDVDDEKMAQVFVKLGVAVEIGTTPEAEVVAAETKRKVDLAATRAVALESKAKIISEAKAALLVKRPVVKT